MATVLNIGMLSQDWERCLVNFPWPKASQPKPVSCIHANQDSPKLTVSPFTSTSAKRAKVTG